MRLIKLSQNNNWKRRWMKEKGWAYFGKSRKLFLAMEIPLEIKKSIKQTISQKLTSSYYHFYITAPVAIIEKINHDIRDSKVSWDKPLSNWVVKKRYKWEKKLPTKVNITKSNSFGSRCFRDDRHPSIWRWKFAWDMCSSIYCDTTAIWEQTRMNCKQNKISKEAIKNTTGVSSSTNRSKFSRQNFKLFAKL